MDGLVTASLWLGRAQIQRISECCFWKSVLRPTETALSTVALPFVISYFALLYGNETANRFLRM